MKWFRDGGWFGVCMLLLTVGMIAYMEVTGDIPGSNVVPIWIFF